MFTKRSLLICLTAVAFGLGLSGPADACGDAGGTSALRLVEALAQWYNLLPGGWARPIFDPDVTPTHGGSAPITSQETAQSLFVQPYEVLDTIRNRKDSVLVGSGDEEAGFGRFE